MPVFDFFNKQSKQSEAKSEGASKRFVEIEVDKILRNPNQPRTYFDDESLGELAESIRQVGLIQPLLVRKLDDENYELIAGERRLRAVKSIDLLTVPCIVQQDVADEDSAMMALVENLQRENLHYMEEAQCYAALLFNYDLTQEELAVRLGKSQSSVANKLRLLKLPEAVKEAMRDAGVTERHARALLKLKSEEDQLEVLKRIVEKALSVKETEALVERILGKLESEREIQKPRPMMIRLVKDYRLFMNSVNSAIDALKESGMDVVTEQTDREDGVDIYIKVTNKANENH